MTLYSGFFYTDLPGVIFYVVKDKAIFTFYFFYKQISQSIKYYLYVSARLMRKWHSVSHFA